MSQLKYCQGPICHEHKTKDRIRRPKGAKRYETRRRSHMYYGGNFCSLNCQDDWFRTFGNRAVDHFGRTIAPKYVMTDDAWYKDYKWNRTGTTSNDYNHYFVNDLLGERIPITTQQYNDENVIKPY